MVNQFTVGELNEYVNSVLAGDSILSNVSVKGEISNYINHSSGHRYFSLKDKDGLVACAMFAYDGKGLKFEPKNGDKVIATGKVGVFKRDGKYQLYVKSMALEGIGNLYEKYELLKNKLAAEGLFDKDHKKQLPLLPKKIGIVTSFQGAAIQDMINIITSRYENSYIAIYPAKVQGENAHLSIMNGIAYFNNEGNADVIIIGRGGGSLEDLWAFNEEELARAIYDSKVPIISAVGHDTDFSISDFVADLRAPTPSAAAELCVPQKRDMQRAIDNKVNTLNMCIESIVSRKRAEISGFNARLVRYNPENIIIQQRQTLDNQTIKLNALMKQILAKHRNAYATMYSRLDALNPKGVLKRGYSIIEADDGTTIDSVKKLKSNEKINLIFSDGTAKATVE